MRQFYRVSQKFIPLISCAITFDQNFYNITFTWNFKELFICPVEYMYSDKWLFPVDSEVQLPVSLLCLFVYHIP